MMERCLKKQIWVSQGAYIHFKHVNKFDVRCYWILDFKCIPQVNLFGVFQWTYGEPVFQSICFLDKAAENTQNPLKMHRNRFVFWSKHIENTAFRAHYGKHIVNTHIPNKHRRTYTPNQYHLVQPKNFVQEKRREKKTADVLNAMHHNVNGNRTVSDPFFVHSFLISLDHTILRKKICYFPCLSTAWMLYSSFSSHSHTYTYTQLEFIALQFGNKLRVNK